MWDWLFQFVDPLDRLGIPYAAVGSVAASIYGEPRVTNDLDLVIQVGMADARKLVQAFPAERFYVPPEEVILVEFARGHGAHLNVIALESMIKADFYPLPSTQTNWFERRRSLDVEGKRLWLAAPEVVILSKLLFFREGGSEKHLRDIRAVAATLGTELDRNWLEMEATRIGVIDQWRRTVA